jgi:hypothetical protein
VLLVSIVPLPAITELELHNLAGVILIVGSPVAIGFSVTKYRLYDIDRIISRTVAYGIVATLLAMLVAAVAAVVGTSFDDPLIVAATTLAVAACFNPLRARVQKLVDRRFNRSRYDAQRVADEFAVSLRNRTDGRELVDGWIGVVNDTMQPSSIAVWTRSS